MSKALLLVGITFAVFEVVCYHLRLTAVFAKHRADSTNPFQEIVESNVTSAKLDYDASCGSGYSL